MFHSLRHSSTSIKLQISRGNIKAVQGDTGYAQARMVTEVYAHTNNEERLLLAQKVDENFFQTPTPGAFAPTSEMQKVLQILAEKPELVRLLAAMQRLHGLFCWKICWKTSEISCLQKIEKILETVRFQGFFCRVLTEKMQEQSLVPQGFAGF